MDNQHRKISGYRELSQTEIDLMNRIKAFGPELEKLVDDIECHLQDQYQSAQGVNRVPNENELGRLVAANPFGWLKLGKEDMQTGLMFLTRAVAQPTFF